MLNKTQTLTAARVRSTFFAWRTILAFVLPLALYLFTLAPTIYNLDSAELTTAAATGGITRATGYPLYLLLGRVWSLLPIGDVGYRMNLFSAVQGALTIALSERIMRRLHVGPWAAAGALGLLACSPFFWGLSLIAEVYTLHTALMAGLLLLLLRWGEQPSAGRLAAVGAVAGLGLCHHITAVLFLPGCLWYVAVSAPRRAFAPRPLAAGLGAFALALCVYLYIPLRYVAHPAFNYAGHYNASGQFVPVDLLLPSGMWWLISGREFDSLLFGYTLRESAIEVVRLGGSMWRAFFGIGIGPGLLGLVVLWRRDWRVSSTLALMWLANAVFFANYRVIDKETMYLPMFMLWALWLAVGYQWLLDWMRADAAPGHVWNERLMRGAIIAVVVLVLAWNWRLTDLARDRSARERGEAVLRNAQPHALILGWWNTVPLVEYLQLVEGQRNDVTAINRFLISAPNMYTLIARDIQRRPVYVDSLDKDLLQQYDAVDAGPMYRLIPKHQ